MNNGYKKLTEAEKQVIVDKGTEPAFSGQYIDFNELGKYVCKRCGQELFSSESKFKSGTGWPSFDEALSGAIKEALDPDGLRTEIQCVNCSAHLGHVFRGEKMTVKNTRHCVNSLALDFKANENDK